MIWSINPNKERRKVKKHIGFGSILKKAREYRMGSKETDLKFSGQTAQKSGGEKMPKNVENYVVFKFLLRVS